MGSRIPKGIPSLLAIVGVVWLLLRLLHVGIPLARPEVLAGPFEIAEPAAAEDVVGFPPLIPFYHPESLGGPPVEVTARRRPVPEVTLRWQGERHLRLVERRIEDRAPGPEVGGAAAIVGGIAVRRHGIGYRISGEVSGRWVELETDLTPAEAVRVFSSLRPVGRGR